MEEKKNMKLNDNDMQHVSGGTTNPFAQGDPEGTGKDNPFVFDGDQDLFILANIVNGPSVNK